MSSAIDRASAAVVGAVESVSPAEFRIVLDIDAPQSTALNTGSPTPFPNINSYLLIPTAGAMIVGLVVWVGIERSAFPRRAGLKDFGLVDLPYPMRKLTLSPQGC